MLHVRFWLRHALYVASVGCSMTAAYYINLRAWDKAAVALLISCWGLLMGYVNLPQYPRRRRLAPIELVDDLFAARPARPATTTCIVYRSGAGWRLELEDVISFKCGEDTSSYMDIVFQGEPPLQRFVEVEDERGHSIRIGEWIKDGAYWRLRIPR